MGDPRIDIRRPLKVSTRTRLSPITVINAGSMAASLTSSPTILQSLSKASYAIRWTGTSPVGTVSIQGSNDYSLYPDGTVNNSGTWTTLTINVSGTPNTTVAISGNSGNGVIDVLDTALYALRLIYTRVSGTGSLTAIFNGKVA
jgi:hypothetical protein